VNIALWTVAGILAFAFLAAGVMKLARNKQQLVDAGMPWVADVSPAVVKSIGVLEILAAIGLIVPALTGVAPVFVPLAAVGLVLVMLGAAALHARRKEIPNIFIALVILAFAALVAWGPLRSLSLLRLGGRREMAPLTSRRCSPSRSFGQHRGLKGHALPHGGRDA
jgi:uncharacterized membrane protein YphA (DoxX/SURF4 family)